MGSFELVSPEPSLTRGWWIGLAGGLALLVLWSGFNVLVDPTGEFGLSGRFGFNRVPPPAVIAAGASGNDPAFFTRAIRETPADVFLIGPSRTWRGFDTCSRPDVLRVAGSAWGLRELERVQATILDGRKRPATVFVEVGMPTTEHPAITNPAKAALSVALSPRTTYFSLQTVVHSLGSQKARPAEYASCEPLPSPPTNWLEAERSARYALSVLDTRPASLARGRQDILALADRADKACRRRGLRHRIVFFTLPSSPASSPFSTHDRLFRSNAVRLAADFSRRVRPSGGCDVAYVNFAVDPPGTPAQQALWRDHRYWSDFAHFSPALGAVALDALFGPPSARTRLPGRGIGRLDPAPGPVMRSGVARPGGMTPAGPE